MSQSISFLLTILFHIISIFSQTNAFSMKMIPIDSPHLQIFPQTLTTLDRHQLLTNISVSRALRTTTDSPNTISQRVIGVLSSYYVTQLSLGEGKGAFSTFLLLDTGADDTWVQCAGCNPCFMVKGSNFPYKDSPSFARMDMNDKRCVPQKIFEGSCGFEAQYSDSSAMGFVGTDTFYFKNAKTGKREGYKNIAFGCALRNFNFHFGGNVGQRNIIAGIHGLLPGPRSFLNQLDSQINGRFMYCIPSRGEQGMALSTMYFGEDAEFGETPNPVKIIEMKSEKRYHLYLDGISVNGKKLPIHPLVFELDELTYNRGFFIDSGAPYTTLARSAYDPLSDAMIRYFNRYGWEPQFNPFKGFDLCYSEYPSEGQGQSFPSMVLHFVQSKKGTAIEIIDMVLDNDNVFQKYGDGQGFCMMIVPVNDPGPCLLGAFQQTNFKFLFDVKDGLLAFTPMRCQ